VLLAWSDVEATSRLSHNLTVASYTSYKITYENDLYDTGKYREVIVHLFDEPERQSTIDLVVLGAKPNCSPLSCVDLVWLQVVDLPASMTPHFLAKTKVV
jgi:hypothetical protein